MMKRYSLCLLIAMMFLLIFDTKTAISGASDAVQMCIQSVIPSLFPFMFLGSLLAGATGNNFKFLGPIHKLCQIPEGCDGIFVLGLLGGYPVGAKLIMQQYETGNITKAAAHRLMGFCNNPGPAFIFGMLWSAFSSKIALWLLWGMQILSAVITGILLPKVNCDSRKQAQNASIDIVKTLNHCLRTMGSICGWILIFRVVIAYLQRWIFPYIPTELSTIFAGLLELVNGCHLLPMVQKDSLRFVICAGMLSLGGICVLMQTASVTIRLGLGLYIKGKLLQTAISIFLSSLLQYLLFPDYTLNLYIPIISISLLFIIYFLLFRKNSSISVKYAI